MQKKEICYQRRLIRDKFERGRSSKEVNEKFKLSWNLFFKNLPIFFNIYKTYLIDPTDETCYRKLINIIK